MIACLISFEMMETMVLLSDDRLLTQQQLFWVVLGTWPLGK
jgi:hypothetical protein